MRLLRRPIRFVRYQPVEGRRLRLTFFCRASKP